MSEHAEDRDPHNLDVREEPNMTWETDEDKNLRRVENLAKKYIREKPLLPAPLDASVGSESVFAIEGLNLPLVHCAFKGCSWASEEEPCPLSSTEQQVSCVVEGEWKSLRCRQKIDEEVYGCCGSKDCLKHHILTAHRDAIAEMCGEEALRKHSYDYYQEAVAWHEREKMPSVGIHIDRRTLKHASKALQESLTASLICACCQCQFTSLDGTYAEMGRVAAEDYFDSISATSFKHAWRAAYVGPSSLC